MTLHDENDRRWRGIVAALTLAVILAAGAALGWRALAGVFPKPSNERVLQAWFYDLNTGKLFAAPMSEPGPLDTGSGLFEGRPAGVRAMVFSCGSCADESQRFVGWLETPNPEFSPQADAAEGAGGDTLIRAVDGDRWYPDGSPRATSIQRKVSERCGGGTVMLCHPPVAPP